MKKILALLLICLTLLPMALSCEKTPGNTDVTTPGDEVTTPEPASYISLDGYTVIRADRTPASVTSATSIFCRELGEKLGKKVDIESDWVRSFEEVTIENDELEILVGATNRKESKDVLAELTGGDDYVIRVVGKKIVVLGTSENAMLLALERFSQMCLNAETPQVADNLNIMHTPGAAGSPAYTLATEYTIIRDEDGGDYSSAAISAMRQVLESITGKTATIATDYVPQVKVPATGYVTDAKEILLGVTNRVESIEAAKTIGAMDYTISITDSKVLICGGTYLSTLRGIEHFAEVLRTGELSSLEAGSYTYTEIFTDLYTYNPLCYDASSFVPSWKDKYNIPEWLCDFNEKSYAITQNGLRNMSVSHRNEIVFYPENSVEGILSAIHGGADVIEIDVAQTKDHVLVLMHDSTLNRTTDFDQKKGKNGLPTSAYIWDWTYEELQQLCLKTNNGLQTEYKIPTLYEAMMVMNDRCFVQLDQKIVNMPTPRELTPSAEIFAMADDIGCKEIFFYTYKMDTMSVWQRRNPDDADFTAYVNKIRSYLAKGKLRTRYWCYGDADVSALNTAYETEKYWVQLREEGKTLLWANNLLKYTQYIADNFSPAVVP